MKSSNETLVTAMRILSRDMQSVDGVANGAIAEAADRIEELAKSAAMYEHVRTLNPCDFDRLCAENIAGRGKFDDLVLADMNKRKKEWV